MPGIRTSISTTSGRARAHSEIASAPLQASPTISISGSAERIIRNPVRTSGWSSASNTRIIWLSLAPPSRAGVRAPRIPRPGRARPDGAADDRDTFADVDQPVPVATSLRLAPADQEPAVVADCDIDVVRLVGHLHARPGIGSGVL